MIIDIKEIRKQKESKEDFEDHLNSFIEIVGFDPTVMGDRIEPFIWSSKPHISQKLMLAISLDPEENLTYFREVREVLRVENLSLYSEVYKEWIDVVKKYNIVISKPVKKYPRDVRKFHEVIKQERNYITYCDEGIVYNERLMSNDNIPHEIKFLAVTTANNITFYHKVVRDLYPRRHWLLSLSLANTYVKDKLDVFYTNLEELESRLVDVTNFIYEDYGLDLR